MEVTLCQELARVPGGSPVRVDDSAGGRLQVWCPAKRLLEVSRLLRRTRALVFSTAATTVLLFAAPAAAPAATYPSGFSEQTVFSGLTNPTAIRFASDGRVFVAEKSGLIKVFDSLSDSQPDVFADLRTQVHNFWDRGLLGLALDPGFPATPYVYVLYTHDAAIGGTAPRWGTPGATSDGCPTPPGATGDGCVVSGRLSRLTASGNAMVGPEQVLIEDWCQQYPSHSIGSLDFGPDGALYVSGGDGASFNFVDYGQDGSPLNPCGDPPGGVGAVLTPPSAEGGALRSQDLRTPADPTSLDGALLRVDPATGAGLPDNPNAASGDPNARRIVAYGLRNPFRFGVRPGTGEVWIGDVGWGTWEEIERLQAPTAGGDQLRLALLRGLRPPERLRLGQPLDLREPLRRGHGGGAGPAVRLEPRLAGCAGRRLSDRQLVRRRHRLRAGERQLPERVPRGALLRRLLARLHLGDAAGLERRSRPCPDPHLRGGRRESRAAPDRARRRPLLRRLRRRHDPPGQLHPGQPAADRGRDRHAHDRPRAADRPVRRLRLQRPGRG